MITDGYCASTCTIFARLMKMNGVRSIAFGGRPRNGPMQALGGVKGSQVLEVKVFSNRDLTYYAEKMEMNSTLFTREQKDLWKRLAPPKLDEFSYKVSAGSVNQFNEISSENNQLPLQFVYEAAECRRFYTYDNYIYQNSTWSSAYDAMFNGGECVPGSTNAPGSLFDARASSG